MLRNVRSNNMLEVALFQEKDSLSFVAGKALKEIKAKSYNFSIEEFSKNTLEQKNHWDIALIEVANEEQLSKLGEIKEFDFGPMILFLPGEGENQKLHISLKNLCSSRRDILNLIDLRLGKKAIENILSATFASFSGGDENSVSSKDLRDIDKLLDSQLEKSSDRVETLEKIFNKLVPKRGENFKGMKLKSQYMAGESAGGDFFDIIKDQKVILLFLSSCSSYLGSSLILSAFSSLNFSKNRRKDDLLDSISPFVQVAKEIYEEKQDRISFTLCRIDLNSLSIMGYNFGQNFMMNASQSIFSQNEYPVSPEFFEQAYFEYQIARGEKMVFGSQALMKNLKSVYNGVETKELQKLMSRDMDGILNEVFFQIDRNKSGDFPLFDASAIVMEVDKNVIFQV